MMKPNTYRAAYLIYRLLQLRFASREQIQRCVFSQLSGKSQEVQTSNHLTAFKEQDLVREIEGVPPLFYVSANGQKELCSLIGNPAFKPRKDPFKDAFLRIEREWIENHPKRGNEGARQLEHYRLIAETLLHLGAEIKTNSSIELAVEDLPNIRPDQTLFNGEWVYFVELENKNELKDIKDKMKRYVRFYFSGQFIKQFPTKKYARVFVVHPQPNKLIELMEFLLGLTYRDVHFTKRVHPDHDYLGRNLFRFAGLDFQWESVSEWKNKKLSPSA